MGKTGYKIGIGLIAFLRDRQIAIPTVIYHKLLN